jgi:hypothetical protein
MLVRAGFGEVPMEDTVERYVATGRRVSVMMRPANRTSTDLTGLLLLSIVAEVYDQYSQK